MRNLLILIISIFLISCDGSGGSSSSSTSSTPSTSTVASFTSWTATTPNVPVAMSGGFSSSVDLVGNITQSLSSGSGTFTRDASNNFTLISATASTDNSALFSTALGDTLQSTFDGAITTTSNKAQTTIGAFLNPTYYAFNYQTYGAWGPYGKATGSSFALSDGSASPVSAIPIVGGIAFVGGSTGYFVDASKNSYVTNATMTVILSYDLQTLTFATSNSGILGAPSGNALSFANLDLTGTLTYVTGTNYFTGTVTSSNGMSGKINGEFYGPGINELGGTFALYGAGVGTMVGGFGGKR
ncbi:transferrin-binding protein-like solute binding protein [Polynucleobacter sp. IMCC 29146]|uniref:transferrin-binding protein-like solute binding protein n=1 Tax=Polynucleobacter sp. IMCC 29146 TaxID=2780953 RepID=UPI001F2D5B34|nr:transferrin-binding protein-like solute binding protein [Polynucleobacter sp. IMCC 29146]MCE7530172.1 transferrin-binding protein-like solute binding protein [Polynucleobacter sp. IMCC 29146]